MPETLDELTAAAVEVQEAVRADGTDDFYGIAIRGAPNCGLNFWMVGSTWGPSFGARWYDDAGRPTLDTPELRAAVEHYVDLVRRAGPPESPTMDFMDCVACYASGRAAMTIEPANEASIIYDEGGPVADGTKTALIPAGPLGTRHVGLYCPPYAIPSLVAVEGGGVGAREVPLRARAGARGRAERAASSRSRGTPCSHDPAFTSRFRPDLVETTVATRAFARGERPVTRFGMEVGNIIGDEIVRVLTGELTAQEAMQIAEQRVARSGRRASSATEFIEGSFSRSPRRVSLPSGWAADDPVVCRRPPLDGTGAMSHSTWTPSRRPRMKAAKPPSGAWMVSQRAGTGCRRCGTSGRDPAGRRRIRRRRR